MGNPKRGEKNPRVTEKKTPKYYCEQEWYQWKNNTKEAATLQKRIVGHLKFVRYSLDVPQFFWERVLWTDERKVELFSTDAQHYIWRKRTLHQDKSFIQTLKHSGGSIIFCFAALGSGCPAIIKERMNAILYQNILYENLRTAVCDLKLKRCWVMQ